MQSMSPSMMNDADAILKEATTLFPECPEAWSLHGQVGFDHPAYLTLLSTIKNVGLIELVLSNLDIKMEMN